jgi:hypothetical protein
LSVTGSNVLIRLAEASLFALLSVLGKISVKPPIVDTLDPMKAFRTHQAEVQRWVLSKTSNFEYLLFLNSLSQRDFHDLQNYPLFPWLAADRKLNQTIDGRSTCRSCPMSEAIAMKFTGSSGDVNRVMKDCQDDGIEAVPEVYGFPEFSSLEYTYGLRKLLESPSISSDLHEWISLIWSNDFNSMIRPLFTGMHPKRNIDVRPVMDSIETVNVSQTIDQAVILWKGPTFVIRYLSGRFLTEVQFPLHAKKRLPVQLPSEPVAIPSANGERTFRQCGGIFLFYGANSPVFSLIDSPSWNVVSFNPGVGNITYITCNRRWVAVAGENSTLVLFLDMKMYWKIWLFRGGICCLAVSQSFKFVVAGMCDMAIVFCSIASGQIVHVAQMRPLMPKKVLITPAWGFVVVYSEEVVFERVKQWLSIFTVNGKQFRKHELLFAMDTWCTWRSRQGFDYIAIADYAGNLFVAEVYFIESLECVYRAESRIVRIAFLEDFDSIVVIADVGRISIVPFLPNA